MVTHNNKVLYSTTYAFIPQLFKQIWGYSIISKMFATVAPNNIFFCIDPFKKVMPPENTKTSNWWYRVLLVIGIWNDIEVYYFDNSIFNKNDTKSFKIKIKT